MYTIFDKITNAQISFSIINYTNIKMKNISPPM